MRTYGYAKYHTPVTHNFEPFLVPSVTRWKEGMLIISTVLITFCLAFTPLSRAVKKRSSSCTKTIYSQLPLSFSSPSQELIALLKELVKKGGDAQVCFGRYEDLSVPSKQS